MADPEQLTIIQQGTKTWNKWRQKNPDIQINLEDANLQNANLSGANLFRTDLSKADLREAHLSKAHLRNANLSKTNLQNANLSKANLQNANLSKADLREANLSKANLSRADLREANLSKANLSRADLREANLTGVCIEYCYISSKTNLDNVICDYIYLKEDQRQRQPSDPNRKFKPGEFAQMISSQKLLIIEESTGLIIVERKYGDEIIQETHDTLALGNDIDPAWDELSIGTYIRKIDDPNEVDDTIEGLWIYTNDQDERTIYLTGKTADLAFKHLFS